MFSKPPTKGIAYVERLALLLVAVFTNAAAIRRFSGLYARARHVDRGPSPVGVRSEPAEEDIMSQDSRASGEGNGRIQLRKDILARGEEHTGTTSLTPHVLVAGACLGTVVVSGIELPAIDQQLAVE